MRLSFAVAVGWPAWSSRGGVEEARRIGEHDKEDEEQVVNPAPLNSALLPTFCNAGGFAYLIELGNFEVIPAFAPICPGGWVLAARALLESGLGHEDAYLRKTAAEAVGWAVSHFDEDEGAVVGECMAALAERLSVDRSALVRMRCVTSIGVIAKGVPGHPVGGDLSRQAVDLLFGRALADRGRRGVIVRKHAAQVLADLAIDSAQARGDDGLAERYVHALVSAARADSASAFREAAAALLGRVASAAPPAHIAERCIAELELIAHDDDSTHVRCAAVEALGAVAMAAAELSEQCVASLCGGPLQSPETFSVRHTAVEVLGAVAMHARHAERGAIVARCVSALNGSAHRDIAPTVRRDAAELLVRIASSSDRAEFVTSIDSHTGIDSQDLQAFVREAVGDALPTATGDAGEAQVDC